MHPIVDTALVKNKGDRSMVNVTKSYFVKIQSCQSSSKSVNKFLSYQGNKVRVTDGQTDKQTDNLTQVKIIPL